MEGFQVRRDGLNDPDLVTERVLDEARRTYDGLDPAFLEQVVRQVVADLWGEAITVTSFIPVLAMRRVREVVEARTVGALGAEARPA